MIEAINWKVSNSLYQTKFYFEEKKQKVVEKFDEALVRYDGWWLVLLAVIMVLALVIGTGLAIWCMVSQGKKFTGNWKWSKQGVSISTECK